MPDKSHVSLERHKCPVCGTSFDTGNILLDKRFRPSLERYTTTGWGLCPTHQRLYSEGFVALVECDPQRSGSPHDRLKLEQVYRTGRLAHLKREVFAQLFTMPVPDNQPFVFVEPGLLDKLQALVEPPPTESRH
ncbi:ATPase [Pseudomonas aeruginosa]|uniref:hypothetical protein n=1 Tax=Pseudomonas aeruginosa TaxID=287 RepID=UPI00053E1AD9|nr:hypothetical protein [Pseudomonas aeruginosa]WCV81051.1 ATPase [Pseudomonas aeruginosa]HBO0859775.1 ATPase [Pseudomonas aeruginosa]HCE6879327.1 ATPase [Pseudomonas aeruginosa]HDR2971914.1 ATPase [Pseudomonas aeruginosa]